MVQSCRSINVLDLVFFIRAREPRRHSNFIQFNWETRKTPMLAKSIIGENGQKKKIKNMIFLLTMIHIKNLCRLTGILWLHIFFFSYSPILFIFWTFVVSNKIGAGEAPMATLTSLAWFSFPDGPHPVPWPVVCLYDLSFRQNRSNFNPHSFCRPKKSSFFQKKVDNGEIWY